jgi:mono/diheme cytochrome c family protein
MKRTNLPLNAAMAIGLALLSTSCATTQSKPQEPEAAVAPAPEELVQRGEYLVTVIGCHDCHSPKRMGPNGPEIIPELMLSGYPQDRPTIDYSDPLVKEGFALFYPDLTASIGPWGTSFAGNITSDPTGIGNWSEEQFKKALTEGKYKGMDETRMLLPPMPWFNYTSLTDEDVKAIFMYLQSTKPVSNIVPQHIPPAAS